MLILSRRSGESIVIQPSEDLPADMTVGELFADGDIEITVLKGMAKLGIDAPRALDVDRDEGLE